ncbi:hypothetical protein WA1_40030 [Scytonema hofmannii PCC 7110]|uniref:Peptidase M10 serralysin C-terminal domain-containing protein n=1 Tax=Scytonema hofmannii PCC 7110 TaxID=128403 RepID=A0A139WZ56_9CYAN|nr:hypothetical protein [Scytonema hofmannii]KYC37652.1 hypothetical protein WA1_40030 [Scytonema hofmannii PCC 7110]
MLTVVDFSSGYNISGLTESSSNNSYSGSVVIAGGDGNDALVGDYGDDVIYGGNGDDTIDGGYGNDVLSGGRGADTLTGGEGKDTFLFSDYPFYDGTPTQTDVLTDFRFAEDKVSFNKQQFGVDKLTFQAGNSSQLYGDSNLLVLLDPFPNAAAAAKAIADNNAITATKGFFVYFNLNLGFSRVVYSQDLNQGGSISVLGNLVNQTDITNQALFTAQNFDLG